MADKASTPARDPAMAPIFEGWNVWGIDQKKDLDFEVLMVGLDRDRRLRIWVEDHVRLDAPGTKVADPIDIKGSQVQIVPGETPEGLAAAARKEQVPGDVMLLDGPSDLRVVRFFNHGSASSLPWPHDSNYILDAVYQPDPKAAVSSGTAPRQIGSGTADDVVDAAGHTVKVVAAVVGAVAFIALGVVLVKGIATGTRSRLAA